MNNSHPALQRRGIVTGRQKTNSSQNRITQQNYNIINEFIDKFGLLRTIRSEHIKYGKSRYHNKTNLSEIKQWLNNLITISNEKIQKEKKTSKIYPLYKKIIEQAYNMLFKTESCYTIYIYNNLYKIPMLSSEILNHINNTCNDNLQLMVVGNVPKINMITHLRIRVPIWISNNLNLNSINKIFYNLIFNNPVENNSKILDSLNLKTNINYCVIGKMNVIGQSDDNYHAIHAYGINFESRSTVEYQKYNINSGLNEGNIQKIKEATIILYRNIIEGAINYRNRYYADNDIKIIIPGMGMGAYLSSIRQENKSALINLYMDTLMEVLKDIKPWEQKVDITLAFLHNNKDRNERKQSLIRRKLDINGLNNIVKVIDDLFTPFPSYDGQLFYVNAWDNKSFIGNGLRHDPSVDGWFVAGYNFNKDLKNNSFLHNMPIFNPKIAEYVTLQHPKILNSNTTNHIGSGKRRKTKTKRKTKRKPKRKTKN